MITREDVTVEGKLSWWSHEQITWIPYSQEELSKTLTAYFKVVETNNAESERQLKDIVTRLYTIIGDYEHV